MTEENQSSAVRKPNVKWRVVDIVVAAIVAVASGVIFWAWDFIYAVPTALFDSLTPGLGGLFHFMWLFAGPLVAIIIRKPGAAFFGETIAAVIETLLGNPFGVAHALLIGMAQGLGAEIGFAVFAYRKWNLLTVTLAGALTGLSNGLYEWVVTAGWSTLQGVVFTVCCVISGAVFGGALMWFVQKALAKTGVLDRFESWPEPRNSQSNNKHRKHAGRPPAYPRKEKIMTNHVPEATKPASGDYAWLGAEAGSVADLMYMLNTEDWYDAINSRFVSELLDDTLPESILKAYLIQDFKFYNNGMMARLIKLAPRQETKDMLAAQSQWFADNEATYFEHFLEAYHVSQEEYDATEPTPANKEYGAYLDSLSDKSWPELITAICCMEWLYLAWAKRTVDADVIQQVPAHKGWVDLHEGAHFRKWVGDLISLVNEYCSIDGPEAEVFRTIVHLERRFFDDSYPQE